MHIGQLVLVLHDNQEVFRVCATDLLLGLNDEIQAFFGFGEDQSGDHHFAQDRDCLQDLLDRLLAKDLEVLE